MNQKGSQLTTKFTAGELRPLLADALVVAYVDVALNDELDAEADGDKAYIIQYSTETNEPVAKFEIRFDITEVQL